MENKKAVSPLHFGNTTAAWKFMDLPAKSLAFHPILTDGLVLSGGAHGIMKPQEGQKPFSVIFTKHVRCY
jgi:hypothetical protein